MGSVAARPVVSVWSTTVIGACCFLLSFPVGLLLAALNWRALARYQPGFADKARLHFIGAGIGAVAMILMIVALPGAVGRYAILFADLGVLFYLRNAMKNDLSAFSIELPGAIVEIAPWWTGAGIGLAVTAVIFAVAITGLVAVG